MIKIELKLVIVLAALLLSLISDLRTYKINNVITYGFMAAGLTINLLAEGPKGMMFSMQGIIIPVACLLLLYMMRMLGAGDIKLFSAIGAVMGAGFALYAMAYSFICGGIIASFLILVRRNGVKRFKYLITYLRCCFISMKPLQYTEFERNQDKGSFHFSIAAATGTVAAVLLCTPVP